MCGMRPIDCFGGHLCAACEKSHHNFELSAEEINAVARRKERGPVAQTDRAADFESEGRGFDSLRARQSLQMRGHLEHERRLEVQLAAERDYRKADQLAFNLKLVRAMIAAGP